MTEGNAAVRKIRAALSFTGLSCTLNVYDGTDDTYFVLNMDTRADDFADDAPQHDRHLVQVHLFAPFTRNTMLLRKQVRAALFAAGCTYPDVTDASESVRAADGTEQHVVFECEMATEVDADV